MKSGEYTGEHTLTNTQVRSTLSALSELVEELSEFADEGDNAFWLHVDSDALERAEAIVYAQVTAILDERGEGEWQGPLWSEAGAIRTNHSEE